MKNMRRHFFIDKPFQTKYGLYVGLTLAIVSVISAAGLYFGIWGSVLQSFSDENLYNEIKMAARIQDYEHSREPVPTNKLSSLRLFKEVNLLSERQIEIFNDILTHANKQLLWQSLLLVFLIACGSIYLTHRIAGPFYRFRKAFETVRNGDLTERIHLRKGDEGMPVADSFNQMMDVLEQKVSALKKVSASSSGPELKSKIDIELSKFKTTK